ncbi:MAG: peptidase S15, partial [Deltaproteobacteria bacterium]|nr:peptidase S15 [Deltaproteobacteria bacterium]
HPRGNFNGFTETPAEQKWLEVHGDSHWSLFYSAYGLGLQKRFFDHFLKGADNGWDREPRVLLNIRHLGKFVLRKEREWPLARTRWTRLYLNPAEQSLSWQPVATEGKVGYRAMQEGVTFRTPPFAKETEITGPVAARLFISSSTSDADLFLVVQLFDAGGKEVTFAGAVEPRAPIAQGWLRASHRKLDPKLSTECRPYHAHDEIQPLTPGEVYEVAVEIWPTCIVIPPGYSLTLTVQGRDFEREAPTGTLGYWGAFRGSGPFVHTHPWDRRPELYGGQVTLYGGGARGSYLLLPVIPS